MQYKLPFSDDSEYEVLPVDWDPIVKRIRKKLDEEKEKEKGLANDEGDEFEETGE